jgi:hypothetical protein
MLDTPVRVARNCTAGRIRSNAEGSKSASAPDRAVKFEKQRRTPGRYERLQQLNLVRQYKTCFRARFDEEDIHLADILTQEAQQQRIISSMDEAAAALIQNEFADGSFPRPPCWEPSTPAGPPQRR